MKILLLSPLPPPVGGIASWSVNLIETYGKIQNTNFEIIHQDTAIRDRRITNTSIFKRLISGILNTFKILKEIDNHLLKKQPDVVHITSSASLALFKDYLLLKKIGNKGIPAIVHFRFGRIPEIAKKKNWEWKLLIKVINKSSGTIIIDGKSHETLINHGFQNIFYLPNPLTNKMEGIIRKRVYLDVLKKENQLIFAGHVSRSKGIFELITACTLINEVEKLLVVGPCEEEVKNELESIARRKDEGRWLKFIGQVEKEQVIFYMAESSILILPSYTEGFPNVILEAMAMECSIIATKVGAIPEMLNISDPNGCCGICVEPKNIEELKNALQTYIKDKNLNRKHRENAKRRVISEYSSSRVFNRLEKIWLEKRENS